MMSSRFSPRLVGYLLALLGTPPLLLLLAALLGWVSAALAGHAAWGLLIAATGGILAGLLIERFLRRPNPGLLQFFGFAAATAVAVITIGYLYIFHIRGPMSTIGTLSRAVRQVLIFLEFLTAQGAGILLGPRLLPPRR